MDLKLTINGKPVPVETKEQWDTFIKTVEALQQFSSAPDNPYHPNNMVDGTIYAPNGGTLIPPKGEQTTDYAERVLKDKPDGLHINALAAQMVAIGWATRAPDAKARERAAEVALYRAKDRFRRFGGGFWKLVSDEDTEDEEEL